MINFKNTLCSILFCLVLIFNLSVTNIALANDEHPLFTFTSSNIINQENVKEYLISGDVQLKSKITVEVVDQFETKVSKSINTDENGKFSLKINLLSLDDGTVKLNVIAENEKGISSKNVNVIKSLDGKLIPSTPNLDDTYILTNSEEEKWGINDKGEKPYETTLGLNEAIKWAGENGYTKFKFESGTYLISKGVDGKNNTINMISNMTLILDENTILKKEANNNQIYSILNFGNVDNAGITGGKLIGDRDSHNYSKPNDGLSTNTHEWGNAIQTKGSSNITIDNVYMSGSTGDGIELGASTVTGSKITQFEKGSIDDKGNLINQNGKIRTVGRTQTNFDNKAYQEFDNFYMWLPEGAFNSKYFDVFFYDKDGNFLKSQKSLKFYNGEAKIPTNADYFIAVFDADETNVKIQRMTIDLSEDITIKNSEIDNTRRQGISVVGTKNINILNNYIHDVRGVAPQSGIDIEPGYFPSIYTNIKGNKFYNNRIQIVLAYGQIADISDNYFEKGDNGSVGVYTYEAFTGLTANNNTFNATSFLTSSNDAKMEGNTFINGATMNMNGKGQVFTNGKFENSSLSVAAKENQLVENISMKLNGYSSTALTIGDNKVTMKGISIDKINNIALTKKVPILGGYGSNESTYENFKLNDVMQHGGTLPAGKFTNFTFDIGGISFNREGIYSLVNGYIKSNSNLIATSSLNGLPDISIDNVKFEQRGNTGYGASIYIQGAKQFTIQNSEISALNSTVTTPFIKIGGYGYLPDNTKIFGIDFKNVNIRTKQGIKVLGIDTSNAGKDAPTYRFDGVTLYNSDFKLKENDVMINSKVVKE
jgi:hypothetical protein